MVLAASPWWGPTVLRQFRFFAVRRVEVSGVRYLAPEAVVRAMGLGERASVFEDLDALGHRVRSLGGVDEVRVSRRLPGTLRVEVREQAPVGLVAGPDGLVAVGRGGRPLPYDVAAVPVDAPVMARVEEPVLEVLATVQGADPGLYAEISAARSLGGAVVLELNEGRVLLAPPVDGGVVRSVSAVWRDLGARSIPWRELDARYRGWVVVRPRSRQGGSGVT